MVMKRLYLDDPEDFTLLVAEVDRQYSGIELWFKGPKTSINAIMKLDRAYGCVDKKIMYRFCKHMIHQLDKEGIVV